MPALPADIGAATRDVAIVTWADPTIAARYPSARDGSVAPADGYFDSQADAQAIINARGALIGKEARRFTVKVEDIVWPTVSTAVPCFSLIDAEQGVAGTLIAARMEIDLDAETTTIELFGSAGMG